MLFEGYMLELV